MNTHNQETRTDAIPALVDVISIDELKIGDRVRLRFALGYHQGAGLPDFYEQDYSLIRDDGESVVFLFCAGRLNDSDVIVGKYIE